MGQADMRHPVTAHARVLDVRAFPGDTVFCEVTLSAAAPHPSRAQDGGTAHGAHPAAAAAPASARTVQWATVQAHGQCVLGSTWIDVDACTRRFGGHARTATQSATALPDYSGYEGNRRALFASETSVLLCNETLEPGERRMFLVHCALPPNIPPYHSGSVAKFQYMFTLGLLTGDATAVRLVHIPFRVVHMPGARVRCDLGGGAVERPSLVIAPLDESNRMAAHVASERLMHPKRSQFELEQLEVAHGRQQPLTMNIRRGAQRVGTCTLAQVRLWNGDVVDVHMDFAGADVRCYAVHVRLVSSECAADEVARVVGGEGGAEEGAAAAAAPCAVRRVWAEQRIVTLHHHSAHLSVQVPHDAPPSMHTPVVRVTWALEFAFSTLRTSIDGVVPVHAEALADTDKLSCSVDVTLGGFSVR